MQAISTRLHQTWGERLVAADQSKKKDSLGIQKSAESTIKAQHWPVIHSLMAR